MAMVKFQLRRLSEAKAPDPQVAPWWALLRQQWSDAARARQYRRHMARQ